MLLGLSTYSPHGSVWGTAWPEPGCWLKSDFWQPGSLLWEVSCISVIISYCHKSFCSCGPLWGNRRKWSLHQLLWHYWLQASPPLPVPGVWCQRTRQDSVDLMLGYCLPHCSQHPKLNWRAVDRWSVCLSFWPLPLVSSFCGTCSFC